MRVKAVDGLVLAGGQSLRMGRDKAQLPVSGKTLLQHQLGVMSPVTVHLFVAGAGVEIGIGIDTVAEGWPANAVPLDDVLPGRQGPLSGIMAALQSSAADVLWVMPCDSFGFSAALLETLSGALQESGADIAYVKHEGDDHPLLALWRTAVTPALGEFLQAGGRSVFRWYATQKVVAVEIPRQQNQCFNLNTPGEYQALLDQML